MVRLRPGVRLPLADSFRCPEETGALDPVSGCCCYCRCPCCEREVLVEGKLMLWNDEKPCACLYLV